jgi:hypothetical protein
MDRDDKPLRGEEMTSSGGKAPLGAAGLQEKLEPKPGPQKLRQLRQRARRIKPRKRLQTPGRSAHNHLVPGRGPLEYQCDRQVWDQTRIIRRGGKTLGCRTGNKAVSISPQSPLRLKPF